ncbi:hypothetical protein IWW36_001723 [Coemansia brasiliensis]|uniref:N-acetyltransferase domain-containing protein n=1 Tax=Coemansia brasiliensis TaxID=2650707 RepID=A0A9W8IDD9_9FUNG|nr:hypothetical protein IWW36_001723 [Coemansia brasiliensis]
MVLKSRSILPVWYAESRFLHSAAIREIVDSADSFVFGRMFKTPTNSTYRDGNHILLTFCHLEYPWDCNGVLSDPPTNLASIVAATYNYEEATQQAIPRCIIDCTLKESSSTKRIIEEFKAEGFSSTAPMEDKVMRLLVTEKWKQNQVQPSYTVRLARMADLDQLVECNASSFGYPVDGQQWIKAKLQRQLESRLFSIYVVDVEGEIAAFVVLYEWVERARDLAWVQVIGTKPNFRHQGLASALLSYAIGLLAVGTKVYLEAEDQVALALYEKIGFEHVGTIVSVECLLSK